MILSDKDIKKRIKKGDLKIEPFDASCVQPSTYDLHLGNEFRIFNSHKQSHIDLKKKFSLTRVEEVKDDEGFVLHPSEFVLASTGESFKIPTNVAAKLEGKSSLGGLGLVVQATAGYIDPGFEGEITFEMSNMNTVPIVLYPGMKVAQICFFTMTSEVERPYGKAGNKYQGQMGPTESRAWQDFEKKE